MSDSDSVRERATLVNSGERVHVDEAPVSKESLNWAESCKAAQRTYERMEDLSREASKREAALIEELNLEDVEL